MRRHRLFVPLCATVLMLSLHAVVVEAEPVAAAGVPSATMHSWWWEAGAAAAFTLALIVFMPRRQEPEKEHLPR